MERVQQYTETKRFSRGLGIATISYRVTTIICLAISLTLLLTDVLRVPYGKHQVYTQHYYDVSGFRSMLTVIVVLIVYSVLQMIFAIIQTKENRDPNFVCLYSGESFVSIILFLTSLEGFLVTRVYQKWLRTWLGTDGASEYNGYFVKSYVSAGMILLALVCQFLWFLIFCCGHVKKVSLQIHRQKSSKVNAVVEDA